MRIPFVRFKKETVLPPVPVSRRDTSEVLAGHERVQFQAHTGLDTMTAFKVRSMTPAEREVFFKDVTHRMEAAMRAAVEEACR